MVSYRRVWSQRWLAVIAFLLYDVLQILVVGYIGVERSDNIVKFRFFWRESFSINTSSVIFLLTIPFILSYLSALGAVNSREGLVQVLGPESLLRRVRQEFAAGNPEGKEYNETNVQQFLQELAIGQPPGTVDNLNMLLSMGLESEKLIEKSGIKSIKRVYVSDQNIPNAFTLRVLPIPFIGQDWIIINRNVIDILDLPEIHAVVAHEIGHAARYDSWINSFLASPRLIIIFAWSIVFARMAQIIIEDGLDDFSLNRFIAIVIFFAFVRVILSAAYLLTSYTYRRAELLADYYSANLIGSDILVNALIKIGRRAEVFNSVMIELDWLEKRRRGVDINRLSMNVLSTLKPEELSAENTRKYALQSYVTGTLSEVFHSLKINVSKDEFQNLVNQSIQNLESERVALVDQERARLRIGQTGRLRYAESWDTYDVDNNEYLDKEEIGQLVSRLKTSDKRIFENEVLERFGLVPTTKTHPQVSDRITFIYDSVIVNEQSD